MYGEISNILNNKIKILPVNLSNKIAAGEVVERPASVVKELIENAVDAEATRITLVLKQSGKQLIQVIDNGIGMSPEDLKFAVQRHATSKIYTEQDLEKIETLGFRGEALPSIASVSQMEIRSRDKDTPIGNILRIEAGEIIQSTKISCPQGTNIAIKNLFYNTPARRNFLRADSTELHQIVATLKRFFLAYPDVFYEIIHDDTKLFQLKAGNIEERIKSVFGEEMFAALIPVNESLGGVQLSGFISRPDKVRRSAGNQFLFLNGRPIHNKSLNHAIFQGYGNLIGQGQYPTYCLFLEMNPKLVDVNVHPTKMEVRFSNDRSIYYFFISSLHKAFSNVKIVPKIGESNSEAFLARFNDNVDKPDIAQELKDRSKYMSRGGSSQLSLVYFQPEKVESEKETESQIQQGDLLSGEVEVKFWQLHDRYILTQVKSGMVIIDQHVAHERILFEQILKILQEGKQSVGQQLLAIPVDVKVGREAQVILDIIDYYKENSDKKFDPFEKIAAAFACKNAIKAGEALTQSKMHALIDQLFACESPYFCPHGRPVVIIMDLEEFDRKFKRIS